MRAVSKLRAGAPFVLVLAVAFGVLGPSEAIDDFSVPDPSLLPEASIAQGPRTGAYGALGVPMLSPGRFYLDPATGVKVYKMTSASWPAASANWSHDSLGGGHQASLPHDGGTRAVLVRQDVGAWWLVDFTPGTGVSNPRLLAGAIAPSVAGAFTFSNNPATPYYAFVGNGSDIRRFDLRTMAEAPGNGWPVSGEPGATGLRQSENDGTFVWLRGGQPATVVAFDPGTNTKKTYTGDVLDARIDHAGRYVGLLTAGNALAIWDWNSGEVAWSAPADPGVAIDPIAILKRRWLVVERGASGSDLTVLAPDAPQSARHVEAPGGGAFSHGSGHWIQHPGDLDDQWALLVRQGGGRPSEHGRPAAEAFVFVTPNGQRRLLAHPYDSGPDTSAQLSPDGRYVLFASDMRGSGRRDVFLAELPVSAVDPDTTPPAVSITAPNGGTTVAGSAVTVQALASDDLEVLGVRFKLDGADLGAEDTVAPYSVSWDTRLTGYGTHMLTAVARDAAGNVGTSNAVGVTVASPSDSGLRPFMGKIFRPQDTFINIDAANHSANPRLYAYTWPDNRVANAILMRFDLLSLPPGTVVADATLRLALVESDTEAAATYRVSAHKVVGKNPVITGATGYTADGVTAWTPNACCYNNIPLAQADISPAYDARNIDKAPGYKYWSITAIVQDWVTNPSSNFGLLLNSDASQPRDHYRTFASMEHPTAQLRPRLSVTYVPGPDVTPPVISAVLASAITTSGAKITWTTNEAADSQVDYGTTTAYGSQTLLDTTRVTAHSQTLSGLSANTLYHFRVRSRDLAGNLGLSGDSTFTTLAGDSTPPTAAITTPAPGATVAGTVPVAANASDNVGVVGVQFKLDGANLGAEDTAAPYSISWNTTTATNGGHTLTAVARDAAGNQGISAPVPVTVSNTSPGGGIAASYPGDIGIENHPDVVFVERFEETSLPPIFARWTDILNGGAMLLSPDVPAGSPGTRSLEIPWVGGGVNSGGHLYKLLANVVDDRLYIRYYIKYPANTTYSHNGIWMGGYNPPLAWPNPQAGMKPVGNDRFSGAAEQNTQTLRFDHYDYWMTMHQSGDGNYWGNLLLNDPNVQAAPGQWTCVEQMIRLNNPTTAFNGEHAIWLQGTKVSHLGAGFPNGFWSGGIFTQNPNGSPFEGFRWRSDAALKLNWIWLQVYAPSAPPGVSSSIKYDHVVLAKSYVGCQASGPPDTSPPTVSISAPPSGAIVSGTATVAANAADNVGVAGVQFKLDGANLGAEDTTAPYSISWNTTSTSNGPHTLAAVARDAAGNTATSPPVPVTVANAPGTSWPNEPAGFVVLNDQPWNVLVGNGWSYLRRGSSKDDIIATDSTAPFSPLNVLKIIFTTDMPNDSEPSVHWMGMPTVREVYTAWWMKVSPNWSCSPAGCGKITFLFSSGDIGQVYTGIYHPATGAAPPYRVAANTEWAPYGQHIWYPNVTTTDLLPGQWYRVEFYYKWETTPGAADGIIRWWVNGTLNGNHVNVQYPNSPGFYEFQYAPTLQNPPTAEQYMYIDHTRVSRR